MSIQDGYHLNVAIVLATKAWDWTPQAPRHVVTHFCAVYCGRDHADAMRVCAEFAARFPEGDEPGMFKLSLTQWQSRGANVAMPEAPEPAAPEPAAIVPGMRVAFMHYGKPMIGVVERAGTSIVHLVGGRWLHVESVSPAIEGAE